MRNPEFTGTLAEALAFQGRWTQAVATVADAIGICERDGQTWCLPDLRRLRGDLLLAQPAPDADATGRAENSFTLAIEEARVQGARLYELRAALSLARLWTRQGNAQQAVQLLQPYVDSGGPAAARDIQAARDLIAAAEPNAGATEAAP